MAIWGFFSWVGLTFITAILMLVSAYEKYGAA